MFHQIGQVTDLNISKAEEIDDGVGLVEVHLPGDLPDPLYQDLGLPGAVLPEQNSVSDVGCQDFKLLRSHQHFRHVFHHRLSLLL